MPRQTVDDLFSSSPAHPSHHNKRNPYAVAQRNFNLKRTAAEAALPSPPTTQVKRKHYVGPALSASEDDDFDDDETPKTPTRANFRSKRLAAESPDQTTPKGRATVANNMPPNDASPALSIAAMHESASRSPSPSPYRQSLSPLPRKIRSGNKTPKTLMDEFESDSDSVVEPATPRPHAPVTPPTRRTRALPRGPARDSPDNPFLSTSPRYPKKDNTALQERGTITYVFRGVKVPTVNHLKKKPGEPDASRLSPSHSDYSPSDAFVPKLLFPSSPTPTTRHTAGQRLRSSPRQHRTLTSSSSKANLPVARKLFTSEIAATTSAHEEKKPTSWAEGSTSSSSTSLSDGHGALNLKAKAMKEGIKKGMMSTSMVIAHAHGPIRPNDRPGIQREDTFEFVSKGTKSQTNTSKAGASSAAPTATSSARRSPRVAHLSKAATVSRQK